MAGSIGLRGGVWLLTIEIVLMEGAALGEQTPPAERKGSRFSSKRSTWAPKYRACRVDISAYGRGRLSPVDTMRFIRMRTAPKFSM